MHDTCYRRAYYDAGLFVEMWDDEKARKGYCLYNMGCRGPVTYNACSVTKWNGGVSYPIQSGHGCIGCSEAGFWDNEPFYQHLASFPGFGIESTADGEHFIGGIPPAKYYNANAPAHWLAYILSSNCDATADKAKQLGAQIYLPPTTVENAGRMAVVADPQGAVFALFQHTPRD